MGLQGPLSSGQARVNPEHPTESLKKSSPTPDVPPCTLASWGWRGAPAPTLAVQKQAVAQDLVHLHGNVRDVLGDGLDPLHEAGPGGEPKWEKPG